MRCCIRYLVPVLMAAISIGLIQFGHVSVAASLRTHMLLVLFCPHGSLRVLSVEGMHDDTMHDFGITIPFCFIQVTCWVSLVH